MRQLFLPMRIWDLPTRVFHWLLVVLVFMSWLTAQNDWMQLHLWCGYAILALLLFRIVWGFIGSDTARFARFLKAPVSVIRHLMHLSRREPDTEVGHNAAGGWMVIVMLAILLLQVGTGLGSNDDVMTEGPLSHMVGKGWSDWLTHIHYLNFTVIEIVVALHIAAIVIYRVLKGHNLVLPMITGKKRLPGATPAPRMMHPAVGFAVLGLAALIVVLFVKLVS